MGPGPMRLIGLSLWTRLATVMPPSILTAEGGAVTRVPPPATPNGLAVRSKLLVSKEPPAGMVSACIMRALPALRAPATSTWPQVSAGMGGPPPSNTMTPLSGVGWAPPVIQLAPSRRTTVPLPPKNPNPVANVMSSEVPIVSTWSSTFRLPPTVTATMAARVSATRVYALCTLRVAKPGDGAPRRAAGPASRFTPPPL